MIDIGIPAPKKTLQEMEFFLQALHDYKEALKLDATGPLATKLRMGLIGTHGALQTRLEKLAVPTQFYSHGQAWPLFETALAPFDADVKFLTHGALDLAIQSLQQAIGKLTSMIEDAELAEGLVPPDPESPAKTRRWRWLVVGLVIGWILGSYRDEIWNAGRYAIQNWSVPRKVTFLAAAGVFGYIASFFVEGIMNQKWDEMRARPGRTATMLIVGAACAIIAAVLAGL
jgi:hypothetical protein